MAKHYLVRKKGNKFEVFNKDDGEVLGAYRNRATALNRVQKLYSIDESERTSSHNSSHKKPYG